MIDDSNEHMLSVWDCNKGTKYAEVKVKKRTVMMGLVMKKCKLLITAFIQNRKCSRVRDAQWERHEEKQVLLAELQTCSADPAAVLLVQIGQCK